MPEQIVVTGASSYLGRRVVERLALSRGATIVALCSPRAGEDEPTANPGIRRIRASLETPLVQPVTDILRCADRVLHFAWDRRGDATGSIKTNATMVANLLASCQPEAFVFVSSVAAAPDAASAYGQHKFALSQRVLAAGGSVFVPGLVVEDPPAGPYAILTRVVSTLPLALRLTHGAPQVYPIRMDRLLGLVERLADPALPPGHWRGFEAPVGFNDFLVGIETLYPRRRLQISVPTRLMLGAARTVRRVPLPTKAYCDKILTLLQKNDAYLANVNPLPADQFSARPLRTFS